ncbi:hypothetical protein BGX27_001807 [Mortierella sp. AM989]|nr:hypothetical protein BGX27_001807 [Mortierella sp. AM989]
MTSATPTKVFLKLGMKEISEPTLPRVMTKNNMITVLIPIDNDLHSITNSNVSFKVLLALYVSFTIILLVNVLIAIMNDGYSESREEGQLAWIKQWPEVIVEAKLFMMRLFMRENKLLPRLYLLWGQNTGYRGSIEEELPNPKLENPTDKGFIPGALKYKTLQRKFKSVHDELTYLMDNQLQIQKNVENITKHIKNLEEQ